MLGPKHSRPNPGLPTALESLLLQRGSSAENSEYSQDDAPTPPDAGQEALAIDSCTPKKQVENQQLVAPFPASLTADTDRADLYREWAQSASAESSRRGRRFQLQHNGFKLDTRKNFRRQY